MVLRLGFLRVLVIDVGIILGGVGSKVVWRLSIWIDFGGLVVRRGVGCVVGCVVELGVVVIIGCCMFGDIVRGFVFGWVDGVGDWVDRVVEVDGGMFVDVDWGIVISVVIIGYVVVVRFVVGIREIIGKVKIRLLDFLELLLVNDVVGVVKWNIYLWKIKCREVYIIEVLRLYRYKYVFWVIE